jgi:hypothetical protein
VSDDVAFVLTRLRDAAGSVSGVDDEAAAFAAGICAFTPDVADAWAQTFSRPATAFGGAAAIGRAWRSQPTPILAQLIATDSGRAKSYASALVDLASAAATIASPNLDRINAAGFAASAQLRAISPPSSSPEMVAQLVRPLLTSNAAPAKDAAAPARGAPPVPAATPPAPTLEELLAELDRLIGLTGVKDEVHHQTELLRVDKMRKEKGLKSPDVSKHLVFTGNPGTGKTTVARLVSGIYRALGILEKGQLIETDRAGLVAGYVGQTALKTADVVKSAIGGVLFIDEAYSLATDDFGNEAIDTLVKAMEDHRDELVLIVAGYTDEMQTFIGSNPGLESRFRTTIDFADYSNAELTAIFNQMCGDADYTPTPACDARLDSLLKMVPHDRYFGNARYVRNQFEAAVVRQAWRLRDNKTPTIDDLRGLLPDDLETPTLTPPAPQS